MDSEATDHPTPEKLRAFGDGRLRPEDAAAVADHVGDCDACCRALEEAPPDGFLGRVRDAARPKTAVPGAPSVTQESSGTDPGADTLGPTSTAERWKQYYGYTIEREIGQGGVGAVYLARQAGLNRSVALKLLLGGRRADPRALIRFLAEAEAVAAIRHPNVVQVHEYGEHDGQPFLAMEYLAGGSLADRLASSGRLTPAGAAQLVATLAVAVQAAHDQGIVHRDLKPGNVLFTEAGEPKVADFGLAKRAGGSDLTVPGQILGTPAYMAPEQASGGTKFVGPAADVHALGVILYECLTGTRPFHDADQNVLLRKVAEEEADPPRRRDPRVPRDLELICLKCLEKAPAGRYASASELADDLDRYLTGRPIKARPVGRAERGWRWCRRNPTVAGLAATVAAMLLVVTAVSSVAAVRLRDQKDDLERLLRRTEEAEQSQTKQRALLDQSRAGRSSRRPGQRTAGLAAIRLAVAIDQSLGKSPDESLDLRNEAIACLALPDIQVKGDCNAWPPGTVAVAFDADLRRYARADSAGNVIVCNTGDDRRLHMIQGPGSHAWNLRFSPDGQYLGAAFESQGEIRVYDLRDPALPAFRFCPSGGFLDFSPDSGRLVISQPDGDKNLLVVYDLASRKELKRLSQVSRPDHVAYAPDGRRLAVNSGSEARVGPNTVYVLDAESGTVNRSLSHPAEIGGLAWDRDGKVLAVSAGRQIHLWDATTGKPARVLVGHEARATAVAFHPSDDLLASAGWDETLRVWDPRTGHQLFEVPANAPLRTQFSRDGELLACTRRGTQLVLWGVVGSRECRLLPSVAEPSTGPWGADFSPDGGRLVSGHSDGVRLWNVESGREWDHLKAGETRTALFSPGGGSIVARTQSGLVRWGLLQIFLARRVGAKVLPERLLELPEGDGTGRTAALSKNGQLLCVADRPRGKVHVLHLNRSAARAEIPNLQNVAQVAVSPDGRWLAAGTQFESPQNLVRVVDLESLKTVKALGVGAPTANMAFSPDGAWLATGGDECRVWRVGDWQQSHVVAGSSSLGPVGALAFSPDGQVLALAHASRVVRLINTATNAELATLTAPWPSGVNGLCFSLDCTRLAVACNTGVIQLWDLRLIRTQLAALGLDWDLRPKPSLNERGPARVPE